MPIELTPSRLARPRKIAAGRVDLPLSGGGEDGSVISSESYS
jgi:hypothetical protein